jgi:hypothetical protein
LVQVNAALDEVAKMSEVNYRLMAAQKSNSMARIAPADRKRVGDMFYNIAVSNFSTKGGGGGGGWVGGNVGVACLEGIIFPGHSLMMLL